MIIRILGNSGGQSLIGFVDFLNGYLLSPPIFSENRPLRGGRDN